VGQFVLTASLRMQTTERLPPTASVEAKKAAAKKVGSVSGEVVEENGRGVSSERAFADFVFGSLILHGFCVNFIN
jgi:oligosaccharyltransferase complex subunit epsilon